MSEATKNFREFSGVWLARIAAIPSLIFSFIVLFLGPAGIANGYVGWNWVNTTEWIDQYISTFPINGETITNYLQFAWVIVILTLVVGLIGLLIAWVREKIGLRVSGFILGILFITAFVTYIIYFSFISSANNLVLNAGVGETDTNTYKIAGLLWNIVVILWYVGLISCFANLIGAGYLISASPIPFAKFRAKRMKILTKADAAERGEEPREAIRLYKKAGDLSMKLREEDKATEYYQKSREIEETEIIAVIEREEERKRKELRERREKLEEERKEILIRADQAEEKEQFMRASTLYRDAAEKSVDLGEKKLSAQFTAKAKELKRKAKKLKKKKEQEEKERMEQEEE
ncbi:MAG: hypothetical protein GF329_00485 [Candidatus Lokiarchaeota archaeon]|nr:hypothetical protein [Candidatus Lokiarchaeota archaeon]